MLWETSISTVWEKNDMGYCKTDRSAYSINDFCKAFSVSRSFAYSEIAAGRLKVRKAGRRTLILPEDADKWIAALKPGGPRYGR